MPEQLVVRKDPLQQIDNILNNARGGDNNTDHTALIVGPPRSGRSSLLELAVVRVMKRPRAVPILASFYSETQGQREHDYTNLTGLDSEESSVLFLDQFARLFGLENRGVAPQNYHEKIRLALKESGINPVVFIDNFQRATEIEIRRLYLTLAPLMAFGTMALIMAGNNQDLSKFTYDFHYLKYGTTIELGPLSKDEATRLINQKGVPHKYTGLVMEASGCWPENIVNIARDKNVPKRVKELITEGVAEAQLEAIETLAVHDKLDYNLVNAMFFEDRDIGRARTFLDKLWSEGHLYRVGKSVQISPALRSLILFDLKNNQPRKWQDLNLKAAGIYATWFRKYSREKTDPTILRSFQEQSLKYSARATQD